MSRRGRILPREGFYIDPLVTITRETICHPISAVLLVSYVQYFPNSTLECFKTFIVYNAFLISVLWINDFLSKWSRNNWTTDATWDWTKEIVVVTGGSSGIGASIVNRLADDGVSIVVVDIAPLTYNIDNKPVAFFRCDLSNEEEIRAVCLRIREEVGNPTVLVNNAGIIRGRMIAEGTYSGNALTLKTNLLAPLLLCKEFLPYMIHRNHGHIVNVSSLSAYIPPPTLADYAASKAGLLILDEVLGLELRYHYKSPKVRTSSVVLGFTGTPMIKGEVNLPGFILPLMHVDTVGDAIVDALYSGYGHQIYLPGITRHLASVRGFPEWLQKFIFCFTNGLKVDVRGRQNIDPRTGRLSSV